MFQVISLSPHSNSSGCTLNVTADGRRVIDCTSGLILRTEEKRHWNVAVSSCGSPTGLDFHYSLAIYGHTGDDCYTGAVENTSVKPSNDVILNFLVTVSIVSSWR